MAVTRVQEVLGLERREHSLRRPVADVAWPSGCCFLPLSVHSTALMTPGQLQIGSRTHPLVVDVLERSCHSCVRRVLRRCVSVAGW